MAQSNVNRKEGCILPRIWRPETRGHNWALAQKNISLPLRRAENAARRPDSGPFRWHIDCFID
jgi:hypothetical protein